MAAKQNEVIMTAENKTPQTDASDAANETTQLTSPKKRRRRFGDRIDGRRLRTLPPMSYLMPYFLKVRADSQNKFEDTIEITALENFLQRKHEEGYNGMTILHCIVASYVRAIAQRPAVNRFIAGQHIYARNNIVGIMTIKKNMSIEAEDTETKVIYDPTDGVEDVYLKFNEAAQKVINQNGDFGNFIKGMAYVPGLLLRFAVGLLRFLDYFGLMPRKLVEEISPFHGSFVITSMGSLGINAIYHHLYDFGNVPVFLSYGKKYSQMELDEDGKPVKRRYITFKVVTDERICDGYYYASAFKIFKRQLLNPEMLEGKYTKVVEDID